MVETPARAAIARTLSAAVPPARNNAEAASRILRFESFIRRLYLTLHKAFADTLLTESDASIIIVDQHQRPGGHWNLAYPFVTLHQPSAFYGVSSRELSKGRKDEVGLNKGLGDLASGTEVLAYFDEVMRHQFLPTGRVQYFPMCHYLGDGLF